MKSGSSEQGRGRIKEGKEKVKEEIGLSGGKRRPYHLKTRIIQ